jgi:hypothetical protein
MFAALQREMRLIISRVYWRALGGLQYRADSVTTLEGTEMAKKALKLRPWTKEDVRMLKTLAREQTKTIVIARKLKRSVGATHQKAMRLGVTLGGGRK